MRRRAAIPARLPGARRALSSRERSLLTLRSLQPAQLPRPGGTRASASPSRSSALPRCQCEPSGLRSSRRVRALLRCAGGGRPAALSPLIIRCPEARPARSRCVLPIASMGRVSLMRAFAGVAALGGSLGRCLLAQAAFHLLS